MKRLAWLALLLLPVLGYWLWFAGPSDPPNAVMAYTDHSYKPLSQVAACLRAPTPAGLALGPDGKGEELTQVARGITVRIEDRHDFRKIWVWIARPGVLSPAEIAAVKACTFRPDNR